MASKQITSTPNPSSNNNASLDNLEQISQRARQFFLNHYDEYYLLPYEKAKEENLLPNFPAFLPTTKKGELSNPKDCYVEWNPFNLSQLEPSLQGYAKRLEIDNHPPISKVLDILQRNPPRDSTTSKQVFGYLASRLEEFHSRDIEVLRETPFLPLFGNQQQG